jgi:SpoVK/Ycf46/Vps4 family AAA+-type ATPase
MASAEQIKALLESHASGDDSRFFSIALQVAAHEAKIGHGKVALELRDLVTKSKKNRPVEAISDSPTPISKAYKDISGLLQAAHPNQRLKDLVVDDKLAGRLDRIVREQKQFSRLRNHGLQARHKLLLVGPSGTGKTLTASVLAGELNLPLFTVRLDAIITKFMGETASKLRQVFDAIADVRGVYFFDEFDAIGSQRGLANDVGEVRRILNSFLQMIEQDHSNSLIIAATNHPDILDVALFRRFDDIIRYQLPEAPAITALLKGRLTPYVKKGFRWPKVITAAEGLSGAEITRAANEAIKEMLIEHKDDITMAAILCALEERREFSQ